MATAKYPALIARSDAAIFDVPYNPGDATPVSGIYRCINCGATIVGERGRVLPPQNHHEHAASLGPIIWMLLVQSTHTHGGL